MIVSISGAQLAGADPASAHEFFDNWFAGRLSSKPLCGISRRNFDRINNYDI